MIIGKLLFKLRKDSKKFVIYEGYAADGRIT